MDIERMLVSKIIATGQLEHVITKGITSDMLLPMEDDGAREIMEWIVEHHREYKATPSMQAARAEFEDYEFEHVEDPLDYVIDRMAQQVRKRYALALLYDLGDAVADKDRSKEIELEFLNAARDMATLVPTTRVVRYSEMHERIDQYEADVVEGAPPGISFGFPTLDKMTGGVQSHEFVTAAAFSGVGKSTLLRTIAFNMYSMQKDIVILYVSLEEGSKAILRKLDAMAMGLDYMKLKHLKLEPDALENWRERADAVRRRLNAQRDIIILDRMRHATPDKIYAETVKHKPDIVFIDYLSLMRSGDPNKGRNTMWQNLTEITQDLKQNAMTLDVPIIAAAQSNRSSSKDGADLDNVGYSLSVVQDSDIFVALHSDDEMREEKRMEMRVKKNREGPLGLIDLIWNFDESDFRETGMKEAFTKLDRTKAKPKVDRETFKKKHPVTRPRPRPTVGKRPNPASARRSSARPRPQRVAA